MFCSSTRRRLTHWYFGLSELLFRIPGALLSLIKFLKRPFQASTQEASSRSEQSPLQRRLCLFDVSRFYSCPVVRWCALQELFDKRTYPVHSFDRPRLRSFFFREEDFLTLLGVAETNTLLARFVLAPRLLFIHRGLAERC
jgi:hypothetical protein